MKTLSMPGFTAEASLYQAGSHYRTTGLAGIPIGGRGVVPQLPVGFCMANCDQSTSDPFMNSVCKMNCMDGGGTGGSGGGGGNPRCRPSCGPCRRDSESRTGRSRLCFKANCDDYTRSC